MSQSNLARVAPREEAHAAARPVAGFKHGGVEVSVWRNHTDSGEIYNVTIRNSYKDHKSGKWRQTTSFTPEDLAVVIQLSTQAFQEIARQKTAARERF